MAIISISVDEDTLTKFDDVISSAGFKGRSDAFRSALKLLLKDHQQQSHLKENVSGILIVIHDERHESDFSDARHEFERLIKTSIHNQLGEGKCLELFILEGSSKDVKDLIKECRKSGRAEYLKLITS